MLLLIVYSVLFAFVIALLFSTASKAFKEDGGQDASSSSPAAIEVGAPVLSDADAAKIRQRMTLRPVGPSAAAGEARAQDAAKAKDVAGSAAGSIDFSERAAALPTMSILYGTQKGTAERFARELEADCRARGWEAVQVHDLETYDVDGLMDEQMVVVIAATYIEGRPTDSTKMFFEGLKDEANKPRSGNLLRGVAFAVFGLCNSLYSDHYNTVGRRVNTWLARLGGARLVKLGEGDENRDQDEMFAEWRVRFWGALEHKERELRARELEGVEEADDVAESDDDDAEPLMDIEDLAVEEAAATEKPAAKKPKKRVVKEEASTSACGTDCGEGEGCGGACGDSCGSSSAAGEAEEDSDDDENYDLSAPPKDMLSSTHRKTLQKQGYKIIGTHSGVKLCRWTKSMLRGRGGCYKHTFYGIASHLCMEMTPSMACANKCVFCWRHHKTPVGREWRWNMDPPKMIIDGAIERHRQMIKTCRGIPGVIPERFNEAMQPRHCALSLVGEPIIYPEINAFLDYMHEHGISSFMVTNAQFPKEIETLRPVTQLYVSIDAGNEETLKAIDRPLFKDFWQRFLDSIVALSAKGQRTVFRLTLVKGYNTQEVREYAELVRVGRPDFIEVKGVTFAGGGKKNQLTMKNVPWHEEVLDFCRELSIAIEGVEGAPTYDIACEHEHSCCVLMANADKFRRDGRWYTWIDFERFSQLVAGGEPFSSADYMAETPEWGVYGHRQRGFDPAETRYKKGVPQEGYAVGGC
eukprot:TRINITY_DN4551_c0_g1_i1.p1 TRINITY_DN4551_c0_g1~~TRINITY_DN4551_c0_g1_i1.p1  ORF type:complete len:751 (-),score=332.19 TRINITY_DN4551_c0_g1_i1:51-2303(-)